MPKKTNKKPSTKKKSAPKKSAAKKNKEHILNIDSKKVKTVVNSEINRVKRQFRLKFKDWIKDIIQVVKHPKEYFSSIVEDGSFEDPIVRSGFYGFIAGAFALLFYTIYQGFTASALLYLAIYPILAIVFTFGFAGVMLLFAYVCRGDMDFEFSVKAVSSKMFIYPLAVILNGIAFNLIFLYIVYVLLALYILFLMYNAVIYSLNGDQGIAKTLFAVFAIAIVVVLISKPGREYIMLKNPRVAIQELQRQVQNDLSKYFK